MFKYGILTSYNPVRHRCKTSVCRNFRVMDKKPLLLIASGSFPELVGAWTFRWRRRMPVMLSRLSFTMAYFYELNI